MQKQPAEIVVASGRALVPSATHGFLLINQRKNLYFSPNFLNIKYCFCFIFSFYFESKAIIFLLILHSTLIVNTGSTPNIQVKYLLFILIFKVH